MKLLAEMVAIAAWGDWKPDTITLGVMSLGVLDRYYTKIDKINILNNEYELFKWNNKQYYILGRKETSKKNELKFKVVFKITFSDISIANIQAKNVDEVEVAPSDRGYGIAKNMYKYFVKKYKYHILGDEIQYFGARQLWKSLSLSTDVKVDIINIDNNTIIEHDVILHHGTDDWDFDERVWSYDVDKKHIRLILTDILN